MRRFIGFRLLAARGRTSRSFAGRVRSFLLVVNLIEVFFFFVFFRRGILGVCLSVVRSVTLSPATAPTWSAAFRGAFFLVGALLALFLGGFIDGEVAFR